MNNNLTFEQLQHIKNTASIRKLSEKFSVTKPNIIETEIELTDIDQYVNNIFKTNKPIMTLKVVHDKKHKKILNVKVTEKEIVLTLMRLKDLQKYYYTFRFNNKHEAISHILRLNNEHGDNTQLSLDQIYEKSERFFAIVISPKGASHWLLIGLICGYFRGTQRQRKGEISRLVIAPQYRNSGYGQRALKRMIHKLKAENLTPFLWIRQDNTIMQHIAVKLGFTLN